MKSYQVLDWGRPLQEVLSLTPIPVDREVLIKVTACGVCHSDVHIRDGAYDLGGGKKIFLPEVGIKLPLTMGHEIVGTVKAAGSKTDVAIGSECVVYPWIGCGMCRHCQTGSALDCETPRSLGTRRAGGYADYVLVPDARYVLPLNGIDPLVAASAACSGLTAYSALKKLPVCTREDVVVLIGAGGLGLAALGIFSAVSRARVVVMDSNPDKLELARSRCDLVIDSRADDALQQLRSFADGGATAVIDFVGMQATFEWGLSALRKGGALIEVGLFGGASALSIPLLPMRHLKILGSYVGSLDEFKELLALLCRGGVTLGPLLQRPMSEINEIFSEIERGKVPGRVMAII